METLFKKKDRVYCILYGWGKVLEVCDDLNYPVTVEFDCDEQIDYTVDGRLYADSNPILSFTEYTLQGFSQERPIELPEVGELCLVRDVDTQDWSCRKFYKFSNGKYFTKDYREILCYWKQIKRIKILD